MGPSEENPALVSHFDHHSPVSRQRSPSPTLPGASELHFQAGKYYYQYVTNNPGGGSESNLSSDYIVSSNSLSHHSNRH